jgi:spore coat polysaccharide biosynthesis protein SpsF
MNFKVVIIVQARMGSTRLPGKHLKQILGRPMLSFLIERLRRVKKAQEIIIATTDQLIDEKIIKVCKEEKVNYFRGDEENVLDRYYQTAKKFKAKIIVRITADCPLIDPEIIDRTINVFLDNYPKFDYVSNSLNHTFPRGMDVEVFSFESLKKVVKWGMSSEEKEHVTPYYYRHPEKFSLENVENEKNLSSFRLTVDTPEDFFLISKIIQELYPLNPNFTLVDILNLLAKHPDWLVINSKVQQKKLMEK